MNLHRQDVSRQTGKKGNTVHHDTWSGHAWLLVARPAILQACLLAVWVAPALSQHEGHEGHEIVGWVPNEILERPLPLRHDVGNLHEKVTTSSAEAQAFYDQGLNYLASYVWIEAARFLSPGFAIGSVLTCGLCRTMRCLRAIARRARCASGIGKAQSLSSAVTDVERQRMEIRARLVDFLEDKQNLDQIRRLP